MTCPLANRPIALLLAASLAACGGSSSSDPKPPPNVGPVLVPDAAWTCGMPDGIPNPAEGERVFTATLQLGDIQELGATPYGERRVLDIAGGTVTGDLEATVVAGGLDFELTLSNGVVEQEQVGVLRASSGALVYMRTCGVAPAGASEVWFVPDFEVASLNALKWLNTGTFAGIRTVDEVEGTMTLAVYDVSGLSTAPGRIQLTKPEGVPSQPWSCSTATGTPGDEVYEENVTLGSALNVGSSKRGARNVVPITGGTVTAAPGYPDVAGTIVAGGADYQLTPSGSAMILDARYVLALGDPAQHVIVRNCGTWSALVPVFEASLDGDYAFFNEGSYVSSPPEVLGSSVNITISERN